MEIYIFRDTVSDKYFCINTYDIQFRSVEEMETKKYKPRMMYSLEEAEKFKTWLIDDLMKSPRLNKIDRNNYGIDVKDYNIIYVKLGEINENSR